MGLEPSEEFDAWGVKRSIIQKHYLEPKEREINGLFMGSKVFANQFNSAGCNGVTVGSKSCIDTPSVASDFVPK